MFGAANLWAIPVISLVLECLRTTNFLAQPERPVDIFPVPRRLPLNHTSRYSLGMWQHVRKRTLPITVLVEDWHYMTIGRSLVIFLLRPEKQTSCASTSHSGCSKEEATIKVTTNKHHLKQPEGRTFGLQQSRTCQKRQWHFHWQDSGDGPQGCSMFHDKMVNAKLRNMHS